MSRSAAIRSTLLLAALAGVLGLGAGGCSGSEEGPPAERESAEPAPAAASARPSSGQRTVEPTEPQPAADPRPRVVFVGDSLTAGFGLAEDEAYPARVEELLAAEGVAVEVINAGVSGETSAGGLARIDWILRLDPDVVVVELGPNDGLRGLPLDATEENLRRMVERIRAAGARVLLVGLQIPPNYGPDYAGRFRDLYPRLAEELEVPLVPFLLEGVGGETELNLPDGIHPNAAGHRRVAANVLPHLEPLVAAAAAELR